MTNETAATQIFSAPDEQGAEGVSELSLLKQRARAMGIQVPNNISVETLKTRINARMEGDEQSSTIQSGVVTSHAVDPQTAAARIMASNLGVAPALRMKTLREHLYETQMELVRCRIQCMDPKKKDLHGEIFTFANEYLGTVRKFVPFGEQTDEGWHVPRCIFTMLQDRKFLQINIKKDPTTKRERVTTRYVREFVLDVLPPLTPEELGVLAAAQNASGTKIDAD